MRKFSRNILLLGVVSFFTDMASEMLYAVTPVFMAGVLGSSMAFIGLVEGVAELTAGVLKAYSGKISDRTGKPSRLVAAGYTLSALAKPLPGFFPFTVAVLGARVADRVGKGIRTAPRDSILAFFAGNRQGEAFGLHRAFDTAGAVAGPLLGLLLLWLFNNNYRLLFIAALLPGIAASVAALLVQDPPVTPAPKSQGSLLAFFKTAPPTYKKLLLFFTLFSFANSSDVFLILRAAGSSGSSTVAILCYLLYNIVYAAASYPLGRLADRTGKPLVVRFSLLVFAASYAGFAFVSGTAWLFLLFPLYGLYAAGSEGVIKAWAAGMVPQQQRGKALGLLAMASAIMLFAGSVLTGALWDSFGPAIPLLSSAAGALLLLPLVGFVAPPDPLA